ncbi:MAG TPA: PIN domain-containing protein [Solirubrobacterales bacterium]|nr:PIN domain-containing protein [Solirubrobacterales bacterium]
MRRFVVDPGTLVSAVASPPAPAGGAASLVLEEVLDCSFEAIACPKLIEEFRRGLECDYFVGRFEGLYMAEIVAGIEQALIKQDDPVEVKPLLSDPDSDYLVALARDAGADAIVTADPALLDHAGLEPPAIDARTAYELIVPG